MSVKYGASAPWYLDLAKTIHARGVYCGVLRIAGHMEEEARTAVVETLNFLCTNVSASVVPLLNVSCEYGTN